MYFQKFSMWKQILLITAAKYTKPQQEYWLEKFWDTTFLYTLTETV